MLCCSLLRIYFLFSFSQAQCLVSREIAVQFYIHTVFPQSVAWQQIFQFIPLHMLLCQNHSLTFLQITTSYGPHCSVENLLSLLSTLAAITLSTFLLSLRNVTHEFQRMTAAPYITTLSFYQGHFTSSLYSFYLAFSSIQQIPFIHSFTPGFSHQTLYISHIPGIKSSKIFVFFPYCNIFHSAISSCFARCIFFSGVLKCIQFFF